MKKTEQELQEALQKTISTVKEYLHKSGYNTLAKDGDSTPDQIEGQAEDEMAAEGAPGADAAEGAAPSPGANQGADTEGGEGDETQAMMAYLSQAPDEMLHMMLEMIQGELAQREASEAPAEGGEGAPAPEGQGAPDQLAMSMKSEFASLAKSINEIAQAVSGLAKTQAATAQEVATLKKSTTTRPATTRPAAQNSNIQVMEKSQSATVEKFTKTGIENFLTNELRKSSRDRHPAVNSGLVAELTYVRTPQEVKEFAGKLKDLGIQLPS